MSKQCLYLHGIYQNSRESKYYIWSDLYILGKFLLIFSDVAHLSMPILRVGML